MLHDGYDLQMNNKIRQPKGHETTREQRHTGHAQMRNPAKCTICLVCGNCNGSQWENEDKGRKDVLKL